MLSVAVEAQVLGKDDGDKALSLLDEGWSVSPLAAGKRLAYRAVETQKGPRGRTPQVVREFRAECQRQCQKCTPVKHCPMPVWRCKQGMIEKGYACIENKWPEPSAEVLEALGLEMVEGELRAKKGLDHDPASPRLGRTEKRARRNTDD